MKRMREWWKRAAGLFHKERQDAELAEELASHLEMLVEENIERGMMPEEARRAARIALGGEQIKEAVREQRGLPWLESLIADVKFGLRMLRKNPGFTAVAILMLALGIGANTAIFTLVDAIMLRSVPIQNPQSLYLLRWTAHRRPHGLTSAVIWGGCPYESAGYQSASCSFSYPVYDEIRSRTDIFSDVAALEEVQFVRMNTPSGLVEVRNEFVSEEYFKILGIHPAAGRLIQPSDASGARPVAVLSYSLGDSVGLHRPLWTACLRSDAANGGNRSAESVGRVAAGRAAALCGAGNCADRRRIGYRRGRRAGNHSLLTQPALRHRAERLGDDRCRSRSLDHCRRDRVLDSSAESDAGGSDGGAAA